MRGGEPQPGRWEAQAETEGSLECAGRRGFGAEAPGGVAGGEQGGASNGEGPTGENRKEDALTAFSAAVAPKPEEDSAAAKAKEEEATAKATEEEEARKRLEADYARSPVAP